MASKRNLKKDISYLTYEVVSDCYTFMYLHPDKETEKAVKIISEILQMQDELITKVNHVPSKDPKEVKQYFKQIYTDLFAKVDQSFTDLSKLTK